MFKEGRITDMGVKESRVFNKGVFQLDDGGIIEVRVVLSYDEYCFRVEKQYRGNGFMTVERYFQYDDAMDSFLKLIGELENTYSTNSYEFFNYVRLTDTLELEGGYKNG